MKPIWWAGVVLAAIIAGLEAAFRLACRGSGLEAGDYPRCSDPLGVAARTMERRR